MKEHIEYIVDSFTDYAGKTHQFVIAALSQTLPTKNKELDWSPVDNPDNPVSYEVGEYITDYGTERYLGNVVKVVRLGFSICNPKDTFNEKTGTLKAVARARVAEPSLYASNLGIISVEVVKALLTKESEYLKNKPEKYIPGYLEMKDRYITKQKMESLKEEFSEVENQVVEKLQDNPRFLDKAYSYLKWISNQRKGKCKD